jgi:hypothetical protein
LLELTVLAQGSRSNDCDGLLDLTLLMVGFS